MLNIKPYILIAGSILIALGCFDFFRNLLIILNSPSDYESFQIIFIKLSRGWVMAIIGSVAVIRVMLKKSKDEAMKSGRNNIKIIRSKYNY
jgi:hypothetical protein